MKKLIAMLLCLVMVTMLFGAVYADETDTTLFEDKFDGSAKEEYSFYWGDWNFGGEEGGLSATTDDSAKDWPKAIVGQDAGWTDYVIDVDLEGIAEGGIIFRSTNAYEGADGFNGYFIGYDSAYMFAGKDVSGWSTLMDDGPLAPAAAQLTYRHTMHWRIVVQGNTFTAYVDDMTNPMICVQDDTYAEGGVGLRFHVFKGDESGCFKNLTIRTLDAIADELPQIPETQPETQPAPENEPVAESEPVAEQEPIAEVPAGNGGNSMTWILVGAAAVIAVGAVVLVILKKKNGKAA